MAGRILRGAGTGDDTEGYKEFEEMSNEEGGMSKDAEIRKRKAETRNDHEFHEWTRMRKRKGNHRGHGDEFDGDGRGIEGVSSIR
jgi:hypothetical protein